MDAIQQMNWSVPTWDLFILLFFAGGSLLYGMTMGRDRVIVVLVSVYMALAVVGNAPVLRDINAFQISFNDNFALRITFFVGTFLVLFFLVSRSALMHTLGRRAGLGSWWQTMLFSILQVGLLISIALAFLPQEILNNFSPLTLQVFTSYWGKSGWLILPLLVMAVAPRGSGRRDDWDDG
jgi:hypothetical protein